MIKIPYYETSNFVFSNFSPHSVTINEIKYPTVEHAYHAAKFDNEKIKEEIKNAGSPLKAYELGKKYKDLRKDEWDDIKVNTLYELVKEKVLQHEEVKDALRATCDEEIVEENPNDDFWGSGKDGKGQNHMGKILMRIRDELHS
jgi:ribA/ribD-fused uncharacterized protein